MKKYAVYCGDEYLSWIKPQPSADKAAALWWDRYVGPGVYYCREKAEKLMKAFNCSIQVARETE